MYYMTKDVVNEADCVVVLRLVVVVAVLVGWLIGWLVGWLVGCVLTIGFIYFKN